MDTLFLLFRLRLQFGILYSRVVNGHQSGDDNLLGQRDVAERDGAFCEETIGNVQTMRISNSFWLRKVSNRAKRTYDLIATITTQELLR